MAGLTLFEEDDDNGAETKNDERLLIDTYPLLSTRSIGVIGELPPKATAKKTRMVTMKANDVIARFGSIGRPVDKKEDNAVKECGKPYLPNPNFDPFSISF